MNKCTNLQLPIVILKKSVISDTHLRITYTCISIFSNIGLDSSVKSVHTNIFAKSRKLHKFANTNSNFEKKHASSLNVDVYQFSIYNCVFHL